MTDYYPARLFYRDGDVNEKWGDYQFIGVVELVVPHTLGWGTPLGYALLQNEHGWDPIVRLRTSYSDDMLRARKIMPEFAKKVALSISFPYTSEKNLVTKFDVQKIDSLRDGSLMIRPLTFWQREIFEREVGMALAGK
jgi:hypothetical protein